MSLLTVIVYYVTVCLGIFIYVFGFLGSLMNIRILFINRNHPCTFLLIYSSIVDCFVLNIGLLPRILAVGFDYDPTLSNVVWCKVRTYGLRISTLISLYTICLMSIDRFFISCRTVRWRQWSQLHFIRRTTYFLTLVIALEGLPFCILTNIIRTNSSVSCTPMYNPIFAKYASFFDIPILFGLLPLGILMSMSVLIYRQLHNRTHLRKAQRSLSLIILLRILCVLISCGPYTSYFVYSAIVTLTVSTKTAERVAIESFILNVFSIFLYVTYSSSFFVYYLASASYRKRFLDVLIDPRRRRNVVRPAQLNGTQMTLRHLKTAEEQNNDLVGKRMFRK